MKRCWIIIVAASSACASIETFRAEPRSVCAGDEVNVEWKACGSVRLDATPTLPGAGSKPSRGSEAFTVDSPTHFELTVNGLFGEKTAEADVSVAPPNRTFGDVASCESGRLQAGFVLDKQVSGELAVSTVTNVLEREIIIEKEGRLVELAAGDGSRELEGEKVAGAWRLISPLRQGETCDQALDSVRQRLRVEIALRCGP
jgi:hypothetical protein